MKEQKNILLYMRQNLSRKWGQHHDASRVGGGRSQLAAMSKNMARLPHPAATTARKAIAKTSAKKSATAKKSAKQIAKSTVDVSQSQKPVPLRVGVWDLGAWLSGLSPLLDRATAAQEVFRFFQIEAMIPSGLIRSPMGFAAKYEQLVGKRPKPKDVRELSRNLLANDFYKLAGPVRKELNLDYLVGVTPSMVAVDESDEVWWNLFSASQGRLVLASTYELREFAKETGNTFDAYLGGAIVVSVLAASQPRVDFHEPDTGCLFDYSRDRRMIIEKVRKPWIEPECMKKIRPAFRPVAEEFVKFLKQLANERPK